MQEILAPLRAYAKRPQGPGVSARSRRSGWGLKEIGHLAPAWDSVDILMCVNQLAMSWTGQANLMPGSDKERASFLATRRTANVTAVQRLFPAAVA
ncbi:hypothetical protein [Streptomyces sp. SID9124]|uniref:hypothetical protein n=1 Tax=Streptomyces sp. SID9124 TaxID=2706108 RepID=UPI0013DED0E5|nr:hypothetical protein [Streptomyces sp. SID9124]NED14594.1 hypothetical protein [Streptomyces sp. SID9124]